MATHIWQQKFVRPAIQERLEAARMIAISAGYNAQDSKAFAIYVIEKQRQGMKELFEPSRVIRTVRSVTIAKYRQYAKDYDRLAM